MLHTRFAGTKKRNSLVLRKDCEQSVSEKKGYHSRSNRRVNDNLRGEKNTAKASPAFRRWKTLRCNNMRKALSLKLD